MTDLKVPEARQASTDQPAAFFDPSYRFLPAEDSIDLLECARVLYRGRRLFGVIVAVFGSISLFAVLSMTPIYRAEALLVPVAQENAETMPAIVGQLGDIAALVGGYFGRAKDQTGESIATLRSRSLTTNFIREQNLKPKLFPTKWDAENQRWRGDKPPTDLEAYESFDAIRTVTVDRRTGLVSLAVEWSDPVLAAGWVNLLVNEINQRRRTDAIQEAQQSIKYLQQQAARTGTVEIHQSIYRLIEAQTKTIALANARADYAFRVIDPAVAAEHPVRPKRVMLLSLGVLFGAFVAMVVVLARHVWRGKGATLVKAA